MYNLTNLTYNTPNEIFVSQPCIAGFSTGLEIFVVVMNIILFATLFLYIKKNYDTRIDNDFNVYFVFSISFFIMFVLNLILLYYRVFL